MASSLFTTSFTIYGVCFFLNAKPVVFVSKDNKNWVKNSDIKLLPTLKNNSDIKATKSVYTYKYDIVGVESTTNIFRVPDNGIEKNLGKIFVVNSIDKSVLNTLSKGSDSNHSILLPKNKMIGDSQLEISEDILYSFPPLFNNEHTPEDVWLNSNDDYYIDGYSVPFSMVNTFI